MTRWKIPGHAPWVEPLRRVELLDRMQQVSVAAERAHTAVPRGAESVDFQGESGAKSDRGPRSLPHSTANHDERQSMRITLAICHWKSPSVTGKDRAVRRPWRSVSCALQRVQGPNANAEDCCQLGFVQIQWLLRSHAFLKPVSNLKLLGSTTGDSSYYRTTISGIMTDPNLVQLGIDL